MHLLQDDEGRFIPVRLQEGIIEVLADVDSITAPVISPDMRWVAFSGAIGNESLGRYALFVVDIDGSNLTQVTTANYGEFDPSWSPDGRYLVFAQNTTGSISPFACCRLARVDVSSGSITPLSVANGAQRPEYSPDGSMIVFDNPNGIWTIPASGGSATLRAGPGSFDASFSPGSESIVYIRRTDAYRIHVQSLASNDRVIYTTSRALESPKWSRDSIYFIEHIKVGYDSRENVLMRSLTESGSGLTVEHVFSSPAVGLDISTDNDEMFFYRRSGDFRYYNVRADGSIGAPINSGTGYSPNWDIIVSVDLDSNDDDEMFFYRRSGDFRYYNVRADGSIGAPINSGTGYSPNWDIITDVDLDGDGRDEMFFYRRSGDFRYYNVRADGSIGAPINEGVDYSPNWDTITAVDLDGDGQDEMLFYKRSGGFRYYDVRADGTIGLPINFGSGYAPDWGTITSIDLDGDGEEEMFFYRESGSFRYYDIRRDGSIGSPINSGVGYSPNWDMVTSIDLDS